MEPIHPETLPIVYSTPRFSSFLDLHEEVLLVVESGVTVGFGGDA
jgi:hypothetical protein